MVKVSLNIDDKIFSKLKDKIKSLEVGSIQEYIIFLLEQTLDSETSKESGEEEEKEVREKLKELGYI